MKRRNQTERLNKSGMYPVSLKHLNIIKQVQVLDEARWQGQSCYSHVDPHMRSFDGWYIYLFVSLSGLIHLECFPPFLKRETNFMISCLFLSASSPF